LPEKQENSPLTLTIKALSYIKPNSQVIILTTLNSLMVKKRDLMVEKKNGKKV